MHRRSPPRAASTAEDRTFTSPSSRATIDGAPHHLKKRFAGAKKARHWRWHYVEHHQVHMPHSLGLLYEQVTSYLGFLHSSDGPFVLEK